MRLKNFRFFVFRYTLAVVNYFYENSLSFRKLFIFHYYLYLRVFTRVLNCILQQFDQDLLQTFRIA